MLGAVIDATGSAAEITPPLMVIVAPSIFTPPSTTVEAVGNV
jgi:hypothetical protein